MQKFKQLSLSQRYSIEILLQTGLSQTEISRQIGVHKDTIFTDELKERARRLLNTEKYGPELIAAYWKKIGIKVVSHETIYLSIDLKR
jgi:IS30 family transposase